MSMIMIVNLVLKGNHFQMTIILILRGNIHGQKENIHGQKENIHGLKNIHGQKENIYGQKKKNIHGQK